MSIKRKFVKDKSGIHRAICQPGSVGVVEYPDSAAIAFRVRLVDPMATNLGAASSETADITMHPGDAWKLAQSILSLAEERKWDFDKLATLQTGDGAARH